MITSDDVFSNLFLTREKNEIIDTITLFGFTAEEILEAGAEYEDVMALGGLIN